MKKTAWLVVATIVAECFAVAALAGPRPRVAITRPHHNHASVSRRAKLRGRATDNRRVRRVVVSVDGKRTMRAHCRCHRPHVRWRLPFRRVGRGVHTFHVTAVDHRGHWRRVTRTYRVASEVTSGESSAAYRAFSDDSWWNTPLPATAPVDPASDAWLAELTRETVGEGWLKLTGAPGGSLSEAQPVYFSSGTDPVYRIDPRTGPTVTIHIPAGATASGASNPKMTIIDRSTDQGVGLFDAAFSSGTWTAEGLDRYFLSSNGLDEDVGGAPGNTGHRGATMVTKAPRLDEVKAGAIAHRTQCFVPPDLVGVRSVWPMTGSDGGKPDGVPQGIVLRIRPSVDLVARGLSGGALVIARSLQDYGCAVTDGGSSRAATMRLERADWAGTGVNKDSLERLSWSDWEFVQGGYRP